MKSQYKKAISIGLAVLMGMSTMICGCSTADKKSDKIHLSVSGIGGSTQYLPVYVAEKKGWFEEAGLEIEHVMFTNGPVQMESLSSDSWDLGLTGIGGVLSGVIRYDGIIVGASSTDDGAQYVFARKDSPIVKAGEGNNSLNENIYGNADAWKGTKVLCSTGTILQYTLVKTLSGFGLSEDDVNFVAMDAPTIYSSFLAGEGDACVLAGASGAFNMLNLSDEYVPVSNGSWAQAGLITNFVANKNSYVDENKYEGMKRFMEVYFRATDWVTQNNDEAGQYMLDFCEENGVKSDLETCKKLLKADKYYTIDEAYAMITEKAEGQDYTVMEQSLLDVLQFFIDAGNYKDEDKVTFMNHTDSKLLTDVYNSKK